MISISVFASHNGSDLQAIIDGCEAGIINGKVVEIISNNSDAYALERGRMHNIDTYHISAKRCGGEAEMQEKTLQVLADHHTDMIFLAGYVKKLPEAVLKAYHGRVFNIHPGLLPRYGGKGMHGKHVHEAVLANHETETGITIHRVNEEYDSGEIVAVRKVAVREDDNADTLAARVLEEEPRFLKEIVAKIADGTIPLG